MAIALSRTSSDRLGLIVVAFWAAFAPRHLEGQWIPGFDTGLQSQYSWRGITRRNAWVWQSDVFLGYRSGRIIVTAGGWMDFELTRADPRIDEALGLGARVGELDGWVEVSVAGKIVDLALGYTAYRFIDKADAVAVGNTVFDAEEVYLRASARVGDLSPIATLWYDPTTVKGAYGEVGVAYIVPVLPLGIPIVRFGALAGINSGQEVNASDPTQPAYFAGSGITHWDLFAELQLSVGVGGVNLYAVPGLHLQFNVDDATKRTGRTAGALSNRKLWGGVVISWHR